MKPSIQIACFLQIDAVEVIEISRRMIEKLSHDL